MTKENESALYNHRGTYRALGPWPCHLLHSGRVDPCPARRRSCHIRVERDPRQARVEISMLAAHRTYHRED